MGRVAAMAVFMALVMIVPDVLVRVGSLLFKQGVKNVPVEQIGSQALRAADAFETWPGVLRRRAGGADEGDILAMDYLQELAVEELRWSLNEDQLRLVGELPEDEVSDILRSHNFTEFTFMREIRARREAAQLAARAAEEAEREAYRLARSRAAQEIQAEYRSPDVIGDDFYQLERRGETITLHLTPFTEKEQVNIHGRTFSRDEESRIRTALGRLGLSRDDMQGRRVYDMSLESRVWGAENQSRHRMLRPNSPVELSDAVAASQSPVVIMIGHNVAGELIAPDGAKLSLAALAEVCERAEKICVFLSCNSNDFIDNNSRAIGLPRELTYRDALRIASSLQDRLGRRSIGSSYRFEWRNASVAEIDRMIIEGYVGDLSDLTAARAVAENLLPVAGGGGGFSLLLYGASSIAPDRQAETDNQNDSVSRRQLAE